RWRRQDAHDRLGGDALAATGLPQHGQGPAAFDAEAEVLDGGQPAVAGAELDAQVLDVEQRVLPRVVHQRPLGSSTSRRFSPSTTKARVVRPSIPAGKNIRCGAICQLPLVLAAAIWTPQENVGSLIPTPRMAKP